MQMWEISQINSVNTFSKMSSLRAAVIFMCAVAEKWQQPDYFVLSYFMFDILLKA